MTTNEIATKLAEYCRKNDFVTAQNELYADDVVSIEPAATDAYDKETKGLKAVNDKITKFMSSLEASHGNTVSEPIVAGNSIALKLDMDVTMHGKGRITMSELCVYKVKDGKVISEEFFM